MEKKERRVWLMWLIAMDAERGLTEEETERYEALRQEDIRVEGSNWVSLDKVNPSSTRA